MPYTRLVKIQGRNRRRVKARKPHRTHKHKSQLSVFCLEHVLQRLPFLVHLVHTVAMRFYRETFLLELLFLANLFRHHHGHVRFLHPFSYGQQFLVFLRAMLHCRKALVDVLYLLIPSLLHIVIHPHG